MENRPVFYYDFNSPYAWLAAERVNAVLPGFTETRWLKLGLGPLYDRAREAYRAQSALADTMIPEEVAESVVALLFARKITGQLLTVDAGRGIGAS